MTEERICSFQERQIDHLVGLVYNKLSRYTQACFHDLKLLRMKSQWLNKDAHSIQYTESPLEHVFYFLPM